MMAMMFAMQMFAVADGTYKSIISEYTLAADGTMTQRVKKVLKYNTHHSFFSLFGETFVVFNPEFQTIKVDTSYTVQQDGTVIQTPANAFNYVLPSMAAKAPDYNKLTELVITHTGLELGATTYLEYTITTAPDVYGSLDIDEVIGVAGADIDKYQVVVNVPEGTSLRWSVTDSKVKPTIKGGRYVWTFTGVKSAKGEADSPCDYGGVPHLSVTTAASLAENLLPLTIETRDLCRVPAEYLLPDGTNAQRAAAIQKYIVNGLSLCKVPAYYTGNRVRQCRSVMATAYGTEPEKALAMAKLMRTEGLQAQVVVAFPAMQQVKTVRNIAEYMVLCDGIFYSVRTIGESPLRWRTAHYDFYDLGGTKIDVPANDTEIKLVGKVALSAQKANVECEYSVAPERSSQDAGKYSEEAKPYAGNGYVVYSLPAPVSGSVDRWGKRSLSKERHASFALPYKVNETYEYTVSLDGIKSLTKNVNKSIKNSVGSVNISIVNNGDSIVVKRSIVLNVAVVPAGKYSELLQIMNLWNNPNYRKIVAQQ